MVAIVIADACPLFALALVSGPGVAVAVVLFAGQEQVSVAGLSSCCWKGSAQPNAAPRDGARGRQPFTRRRNILACRQAITAPAIGNGPGV